MLKPADDEGVDRNSDDSLNDLANFNYSFLPVLSEHRFKCSVRTPRRTVHFTEPSLGFYSTQAAGTHSSKKATSTLSSSSSCMHES
jgi:hypothetical protein